MSDSTELLVCVKKLHEIANRPFQPLSIKERNDGLKRLCKMFYTGNKKLLKSDDKGSNLYFETFVWAHLYNLNKSKAIQSTDKYEKYVTDCIDGILFDGEPIRASTQRNDEPLVQMNNEEGFRLACEHTKNMIQIFRILIELI